MALERHCRTCTCGLVGYEWSDRSGWVDPKDAKSVAGALISYWLDHSYDRMEGLPYNFPKEFEPLIAIAHRHLFASDPEWVDHTVDMTDSARQQWRQEMEQAAQSIIEKML